MSRASIILIAIVALIVVGLVVLSRHPAAVTPHHIEQAVTLNGAADASQN